MSARSAFLASLLVLASPLSAQARQDADPWVPPPLPESAGGFEALRPALEGRIAQHRGVVGLVLLDPRSGERLSVRGTERFPSASIIKIPVLYEVMLRVEEGRLSLDDPLTMLAGDRAPGSGILQHLDAPFTLTVRDAALLMTALSDNTRRTWCWRRSGPGPSRTAWPPLESRTRASSGRSSAMPGRASIRPARKRGASA